MTAQARKTLSVGGALLVLCGFIGTAGLALAYVTPILAIPATVIASQDDIKDLQKSDKEKEIALARIEEQLIVVIRQQQIDSSKIDQIYRSTQR